MQLEDVVKMVEEIRVLAHDDEAAHAKEDDLYEMVLQEVGNRNPESVEMACEALKTKKISYARWCA